MFLFIKLDATVAESFYGLKRVNYTENPGKDGIHTVSQLTDFQQNMSILTSVSSVILLNIPLLHFISYMILLLLSP